MGLRFRSNTGTAPTNREGGVYGATNLKNLAPTIQKAYDNALQVNGFEILFLHQHQTGTKCSCSMKTAGDNNPNVLDEQGNASPSLIQSILSNASFGIEDYKPLAKDSMPATVTPAVQGENNNDPLLNRDQGNIPPSDNDEPFGDLSTVAPESLYEVDPLTAGAATYCGICLGSGYDPGYSLYGGKRLILDPLKNPTSVQNAVLNKATYPWSYSSATKGTPGSAPFTVSWTLNVQAGIVNILNIGAFNNFTPVNATVYLDNAPWTNQIPTPGQHTVSVVCLDNALTHVEILYYTRNEPLLADFQNWDKTNDLSVMDPLSEVSIALTNQIPEVKVYDLMVDMVYQRMWRITNVQPTWDNNLNVYQWELTARVVQQYEVFAKMWNRTKKFRQVSAGEYVNVNTAPD